MPQKYENQAMPYLFVIYIILVNSGFPIGPKCRLLFDLSPLFPSMFLFIYFILVVTAYTSRGPSLLVFIYKLLPSKSFKLVLSGLGNFPMAMVALLGQL